MPASWLATSASSHWSLVAASASAGSRPTSASASVKSFSSSSYFFRWIRVPSAV
jgi:hypothetical protein